MREEGLPACVRRASLHAHTVAEDGLHVRCEGYVDGRQQRRRGRPGRRGEQRRQRGRRRCRWWCWRQREQRRRWRRELGQRRHAGRVDGHDGQRRRQERWRRGRGGGAVKELDLVSQVGGARVDQHGELKDEDGARQQNGRRDLHLRREGGPGAT